MAAKKEKLQFIKNYTDNQGNEHSILIYKDFVSWGNLKFDHLHEAISVIEDGSLACLD